MATIEVTAKNIQETIDTHPIVLIDFWGEKCAPCKAFGPIFEKASEEHPDLTFGKCNTEQETDLSAALNIQSIPMLMVFREQILVYAQPGMLPAPVLEELIGKVKDLDMEEVRQKIAEAEAGHQHDPNCSNCCGGNGHGHGHGHDHGHGHGHDQ